jgi:TusA-related sulfurtransferase
MDRLGGKGKIHVTVDSGTARENITRLAKSQGWEVTVVQQGETAELTLTRA